MHKSTKKEKELDRSYDCSETNDVGFVKRRARRKTPS